MSVPSFFKALVFLPVPLLMLGVIVAPQFHQWVAATIGINNFFIYIFGYCVFWFIVIALTNKITE